MIVRIDMNGYGGQSKYPQLEFIKDKSLMFIFFEYTTHKAKFSDIFAFKFDTNL